MPEAVRKHKLRYRFYGMKNSFMESIQRLDVPMAKILEYEATDIPIGDTRLLEMAWRLYKLGKKGERVIEAGVEAQSKDETIAKIRRLCHLLEHWSSSIKDIIEIRRGVRMPFFPLYEANTLNKEPILTAEDKIQQAFREEQHSEAVKR